MIKQNLSFGLPVPWVNKKFEASQIGAINFLVGPNGSGKSKFATILQANLGDARLLGMAFLHECDSLIIETLCCQPVVATCWRTKSERSTIGEEEKKDGDNNPLRQS